MPAPVFSTLYILTYVILTTIIVFFLQMRKATEKLQFSHDHTASGRVRMWTQGYILDPTCLTTLQIRAKKLHDHMKQN